MGVREEKYYGWDIKELKSLLLKTSQKEDPKEYDAIKNVIMSKEFQKMSRGGK